VIAKTSLAMFKLFVPYLLLYQIPQSASYSSITHPTFKYSSIASSVLFLVLHNTPEIYPTMAKVTNKAVLIVIDGWGVAGPNSPPEVDTIPAADTPLMSASSRATLSFL
jgi:hypothetical protein